MIKRTKFSEEMTSLKQEVLKKTETIIKLKLCLHKIKTYGSIAAIIFTASMYFGYKYIDKILDDRDKIIFEITEQSKMLSAKYLTVLNEYKDVTSNISLVQVTKEDLLNDLIQNYPGVSTKTKISIIETIISESEKYGMNPLILYSICYNESSFRPWLEHEQRTIEKNGKLLKVRAAGLTGIIWEWHGDKIKAAGIAEARGDLFDPIINIKACALIYNDMFNMEMHKSARTRDESALLRYFGGNYISYVQKIEAKIATFVRPSLYRKN